MSKINVLKLKYLTLAICLMAAIAAPLGVSALPLDTYATESKLSAGRWVKVKVDQTGMHMLSNATLRSMGFNDPSKVRVYGYGAMRLPDVLDASYIDDLPETPSVTTQRGVIFYGVGPVSWRKINGEVYAPVQNPFTTAGYYFVSDALADQPRREIPSIGEPTATQPVTTFIGRAYHESELTNLGQTGHMLVGENFLYSQSQRFSISLPGYVTGEELSMYCSFVTKSSSATRLNFTANGTPLEQSSADRVDPTTDGHGHYREGRMVKKFTLSADKLELGISISNTSTLSAANLNHIAVNYPCRLSLSGSQLAFSLDNPEARLSGASASTLIWDVTDPNDICQVNAAVTGDAAVWTSPYSKNREYIAFNTDASFPEPASAGVVSPQNLHGCEVPDMVIFTIGAWRDQAQRLADLHAAGSDSLKVLVVDQNLVFNEFGSGAPDVNAFRKMLKMFYDRSAESERAIKYALFMGRGSYDNRVLSGPVKALGYPMMPLWSTDSGGSDTESYTSDDVIGFLADGSGVNIFSDKLDVAIGRLPVISAADAKSAVDKIVTYMTSQPKSTWRNQALLLADDDDSGVHMDQSDTMYRNMFNSDGGQDISYNKLYTDRYDRVGGAYPAAREALFRALDEGVAWWFYIGHANTTSITHEKLLTYSDINNLYLKHFPIMMAATCEFLRWDARDISAAEIMWRMQYGGCISIISANRPVYISDNGKLTRSMGNYVFSRGDDGRRLTVGEIYRQAKNGVGGDSNKLRYVLIGDPAMRPLVPDYRVVVDDINGIDPEGEEQAILQARQDVTIRGHIVDHQGNIINDFNGIVNSVMHDAEYSITTKGNGDNPKQHTYDQQGDRIFAGNDSIRDGRFEIKVAMPSAISENFRPAALNLYAYTTSGPLRDGSGMNREFYVYGEDLSVDDDVPPTIDAIYINHPSFKNGDVVNRSPMLIAEISDNRGINLSTAGLGNQIAVFLDERESYSNVAEYYTPSTSSNGGSIAFPLGNLSPGEHKLKLRVWDTSHNFTVAELDFIVSEHDAPVIYDIYSDANPASDGANFYLTHNRPDAMLEVTVTVYNLRGQPLWQSTTTGLSDMYRSFPIHWDLCDTAGRRVGRGIYLYRASIVADGIESTTATRRIAVTGR